MKESPIFIKSYETMVWIMQHTAKFPRNQRFLMAKRQEDARSIEVIRALEHWHESPALQKALQTSLKYGTNRRELRRKRFEAEFEVWLAELPEEKKKQIAGGVSIGSRAALAMLRSAFAEESGVDLPTEG